jgi:excisionase family DNA binding protein
MADYLKVHRETVYAWVGAGKIGVMRVGGKLLFDREEVLASLQVQVRVGGSEGNYECGYDGNETGEAAIGAGDGIAIPVTRAVGARSSYGNPVTADLGRPS